jgi:hypothetical protein
MTLPATPTGRATTAFREYHGPECPVWEWEDDTRCTCGTLARILAIEAEAVEAYKAQREAERKALAAHVCVVKEIPGDYYATDKWRTDSARCEYPGCRRDLGWYCPNSTDHRCHYSRSLDRCDFCGQPEERK